MARLFQRHSSDESLIAWLDGELPFYRRALVRRHLSACWKCACAERDREAGARRHSSHGEGLFPGSERVVAARLRFLQAVEGSAGAAPARPAWGRRLAWAAACLALVAAACGCRASRGPTHPGGQRGCEAGAQAEGKQLRAQFSRSSGW